MPINLGTPELIIILFIILLLFGAGRIAQIGGELGRGIREFREGFSQTTSEQNSERVEAHKA